MKHTWKAEENNLEVKWDPPSDSSSVDHYTATLYRENVKIHTEETQSTEITFKKLEPCANHKITFNAYDRDQVTKYKTVHYFPDALLKGEQYVYENFRLQICQNTLVVGNFGPLSTFTHLNFVEVISS